MTAVCGASAATAWALNLWLDAVTVDRPHASNNMITHRAGSFLATNLQYQTRVFNPRLCTGASVACRHSCDFVVCLCHGSCNVHNEFQADRAARCLAVSESAYTLDWPTPRRQTDSCAQISAAEPSDNLHRSTSPEGCSVSYAQGALPLFALRARYTFLDLSAC